MAEAWQEAWVEVVPDFTDFRTLANDGITPALSEAGDRGARAMGTSMKGVFAGSFFGAIAAEIGIRIVGAVAGAIRAGIDAGLSYSFDSVGLASSLLETRNAAVQIFGDASEAIVSFADTANEALGQTRQQAIDAANTFGVFGKAAGLTGTDLTSFSTELVTLATDLASFKDLPVETAIQAIGTALRGESEPIRQFGVLLDDASLKARALELGIYDGTGALSQQQRVLAAYSEVFDQTVDMQDDFARNQGGYAGQLKIFESALVDIQTAMGEVLLPAATELLTVFNTELLPIIKETTAVVGPILAEAIRESTPAFKELFEAIGPLIPDLVELAVEILPLLVDLLILSVPLLREWAEYWTTTAQVVSGFFDLISGDTSLAELGSDLMATESTFFSFIRDSVAAVQTFGQDLYRTLTSVVSFIASIPSRAVAALSGIGRVLVNSGRALIQGFLDGIMQMTKPIRDAVNGVLGVVAGFFPRSPAKYGPFSGAGWEAVKASGRALFDQFDAGFGGELGGSFALAGLSIPHGVLGAPLSAAQPSRSETTLNLNGIDPATVYQLMRQEMGERLATI